MARVRSRSALHPPRAVVLRRLIALVRVGVAVGVAVVGVEAVSGAIVASAQPADLNRAASPGAVRTVPALSHAYAVTLARDLAHLDVEACLDPGTPLLQRRLRVEFDLRRHASAPQFVGSGPPRVVPWPEEFLRLPDDVDCVRYRVDLARAVLDGTGMRRPAVRLGRDLKTTVDLWLLRPPLAGGQHIDIRFTLPEGVAMSAPWPRIAGRNRYRIPATPEGSWGAVVAFGRFTPRPILLADGARLELVVLDGKPAPDEAMLARWIGEVAEQVRGVHGRFPTRELQVLLVPMLGNGLRSPLAPGAAPPPWYARMPEAVGFGRILRDGGNAAELQVVQGASLAALRADWTATHEFSHLLLPYLSEPGGWISEGFADYYQNLLMARSGHYSEADGWRRLLSGFERGRGDGDFPETLREALTRGGENQLMRRYWTGAVVALRVDVELRRHGDSLDALLGRFAACCLPSARAWTTEELFARLDTLAGRRVFTGIHDRWLDVRDYPAYDGVARQLGVVGDGRAVRFDDRAPLVGIRRAIMARRPGAATPAQGH